MCTEAGLVALAAVALAAALLDGESPLSVALRGTGKLSRALRIGVLGSVALSSTSRSMVRPRSASSPPRTTAGTGTSNAAHPGAAAGVAARTGAGKGDGMGDGTGGGAGGGTGGGTGAACSTAGEGGVALGIRAVLSARAVNSASAPSSAWTCLERGRPRLRSVSRIIRDAISNLTA